MYSQRYNSSYCLVIDRINCGVYYVVQAVFALIVKAYCLCVPQTFVWVAGSITQLHKLVMYTYYVYIQCTCIVVGLLLHNVNLMKCNYLWNECMCNMPLVKSHGRLLRSTSCSQQCFNCIQLHKVKTSTLDMCTVWVSFW